MHKYEAQGGGVKWNPPTPQEKLPSKSPALLGLKRITHKKIYYIKTFLKT